MNENKNGFESRIVISSGFKGIPKRFINLTSCEDAETDINGEPLRHWRSSGGQVTKEESRRMFAEECREGRSVK